MTSANLQSSSPVPQETLHKAALGGQVLIKNWQACADYHNLTPFVRRYVKKLYQMCHGLKPNLQVSKQVTLAEPRERDSMGKAVPYGVIITRVIQWWYNNC
ncbi:hypothetical protein LOTGIDRAFT_228761 [Lottia gigantea]|uniref:Uncharacterized protein n=1 Tax=Lottia gigantea TaxID=225164 RepID=V4A3G9_LOTGI|nr:hypothetical protein LOTGIDRAFT_228761 [Lottia gigantea]ESO91282.1 hypothetical protein LOTGIDRAFT_228761 [Lottia gigantea]